MKIIGLILAIMLMAVPAMAADITLAWDAPTINSDGSELTDLSGYKMYYGNSTGEYLTAIDVGNVNIYTVSDLSDNTWFFAVTAYDTSRNESDYSNEINKKIDGTPEVPSNLIIIVIEDGEIIDVYQE